MKLIGNLKKQVEKTNNNKEEEARSLIEQVGMKLTDDELEMVAGGQDIPDSIQDRMTTVNGRTRFL